MKDSLKSTLCEILHSLDPKVWRFSNTSNTTYNANAWIGFPTNDLAYDNTTVTYNAGILTINKKGTYRIDAHIAIQTQTSSREFVRLAEYPSNNTLVTSIYYGNWAICNMSRTIKVTSSYSFGVVAVEKLNVNTGGIGPTFIEITKLGG